MKRIAILITAVICATFAISNNADAQSNNAQRPHQRALYKAPTVTPSASRPKLGINGHMVNGYQRGYKITYVAPYSVGQRIGLECGDVIMSINDIAPVNENELITALNQAAGNFYKGEMRIKVDNVRFHKVQTNQRYVTVNGNLYK